MSNIVFTADGQHYNLGIETMTNVSSTGSGSDNVPLSMTSSPPAGDFLNLAGNLKLTGSIRATNFYKEDGTELPSVSRLALPSTVYSNGNNIGFNVRVPNEALEVDPNLKVHKNLIVKGNIVFEHPNGSKWVMGLRDSDNFAINKYNEKGILISSTGVVVGMNSVPDKTFLVPENNKDWYNLWTHNDKQTSR